MLNNEELIVKIDELIKRAPENRHSYYQLKYLLLGKEPTTQSQLWQCLTQLENKKETIDNIKLQIEDTKDEIELIELEKEKLEYDDDTLVYSTKLNPILQKERSIKIRRVKRKKESLVRNIDKLEKKLNFELQEATFYIQAFEALEKIEAVKDYDDFDAQKEYWEAKVTEEINLRILTKQPLPPDLLKTALSLHEKSSIKEQMMSLLENCKNQIEVTCQKENDGRKQIDHK